MTAARLATVCAALLCCCAAGAQPARAALPVLPQGAVDLGWSRALRIDGQDTAVRVFEAPGSPFHVAARMLEQGGPRPLLMPWPGGLMMAGADGAQAWSLQLREAGPRRTRGLLAVRRPGAARALPRMPWLPPGARLLLDAAGADGSARQQIYAVDLAPGALAGLLAQRLSAAGWRRTAQAGNWNQWQRAGRRLGWVAVPHGSGSGLLLVLE